MKITLKTLEYFERDDKDKSAFVPIEKEVKTEEQAWRKSLEKWWLRAKGEPMHVLREGDTCGLCNLYKGCNGCPVMEFTDQPECRGTPFWGWWYNQSRANAKAEYDFLLKLYLTKRT